MNTDSDERKWAIEVAAKGKSAKVVERVDSVEGEEEQEEEEEEEECHEGATHGMFAGAGKFLLAGGVVSTLYLQSYSSLTIRKY